MTEDSNEPRRKPSVDDIWSGLPITEPVPVVLADAVSAQPLPQTEPISHAIAPPLTPDRSPFEPLRLDGPVPSHVDEPTIQLPNTNPSKLPLVLAAASVVALAALAVGVWAGNDSPTSTEVSGITTIATVPETTLAAEVVSATEAETTGATMPDVVCMNLQDAQDAIQETGVFFSRSNDASGQDRLQVVDSNWIVVGQSPEVGSPIGESDAVLDVVKLDEPNDC